MDEYANIFRLCNQKVWEDEEEKKDVAQRIAESIKILDENQRKQFLSLFELFKVIPYSKYYFHLKKIAMDTSFETLIKGYKKIVIIPIIKKKDLGQAKSSDMVCHPFLKLLKSRFKNKEFLTVRPGPTNCAGYRQQDSLAIFVDDFIGTGRTALECAGMFSDDAFLSISFVSIAMMESGRDLVLNKTTNIFYSVSEPKIFDTNPLPDISEQKKNYSELCKKAKIKKEYHFGYKNSQALIKLLNTPNNTLGLFWWDSVNWKSPCPRIT